ncbi:MAG: hypothetical protein ACT4P2_11570 [Pseudomonadota bacterium]
MGPPADPIPLRPRPAALPAGEPAAPAPSGRPRGLPASPSEPTPVQRAWLKRGLDQAGGKLPLFDADGKRVDPRTIRSCVEHGWAEPWFANPLKPDWLVCRLSESGRRIAAGD